MGVVLTFLVSEKDSVYLSVEGVFRGLRVFIDVEYVKMRRELLRGFYLRFP